MTIGYSGSLTLTRLKGLELVFSKNADRKSEGVSEVRFYKKLDSFTLETSENHLIRNFLRNERMRVNYDILLFDDQR